MSCNSSSGYMDGVPVKISEQYKPPPRIILPQNLYQRVNLIEEDLKSTSYDVSFETNVIKKITEWRSTKEKESLERRRRINESQEAAKTIENEERRKQLTEVSYPSTDDLSELSTEADISDLRFECPVISSDKPSLAKHNNELTNHSSILQPQLMNNKTLTQSHPISPYNINYSDFENDTSSPFDNMELKTINDIELLAQVLSNSHVKPQDTNQYLEKSSPNDINIESSVRVDMQHITNTVNYNIGHNKITNKMPNGYYNTNFSYNYPNYSNNIYNQPIEYSYPVLYDNIQTSYLGSNNQYSANMPSQNPIAPSCTSSSQQRSKSRSVPDIVKELEDEISKEVTSKRSQNASPASNNKTSPEVSRGTKQVRAKSISESKSVPNESLENPYKNLSAKMQKIAFHISQMGFPLPRTARACAVIGDNDKKVIEFLLAMDQLMDLGFSESKVSEALIKFNNDRDKALDFLIT